MPESMGAKTDLNDILRAKGVDGLQQTLAATVTVDENRSSTDHALYDRKAIKQLNSNNTHESGAEREVMQRYHDRVHQQQIQSAHGLVQDQSNVSPVHSSEDQFNGQIQIDREI